MNKKLKRKQALIMAEPYRTPFNSKVAKVSGDVIEDSVGEIKYATSFNGATKIVEDNTNLLALPNIEETALNGVTYSIKDGVITLNGTCTETIIILLISNNQWNKSDGYYYYITYAKSKDGTLCFIYNETQDKFAFSSEEGSLFNGWNKNDIVRLVLKFTKDTIYNNEIIKPMLVEGSTAPTEFEPYFKNLLIFDDIEETTQSGLTYSVKNGVFNIDGTSTEPFVLYFSIKNFIYNTPDYTFKVWWDDTSTKPNQDGIEWNLAGYRNDEYTGYYAQIRYTNSNYLDGSNVITNTNDTGYITNMYIYMPAGSTFKNQKFKPMFVSGTIVPSKFINARNPYFINLGQNGSVQYNGLEPREIDLKGNTLNFINSLASDKLNNYSITKNTAIVDLGDLEWTNITAGKGYRIVSTSLVGKVKPPANYNLAGNCKCIKYITFSGNDNYNGAFNSLSSIAIFENGNICIYDPLYNTTDKLEDFKRDIKGTSLLYELKDLTTINTTSFKTFKEDTNATISDDNFTSSPNAITETFKPTRSYDFKVNGFSNVVKSSNLLSLPDIEETTINGITYSIKDGVITFSGTATANTSMTFNFVSNVTETANDSYYWGAFNNKILDARFGIITNETSGSYTAYEDFTEVNKTRLFRNATAREIIAFFFNFSSGANLDGFELKPMLIQSETAPTTFEPYFDPYIESFADKKNLLSLPDIEETTIDGITYSIKDGVLKLNGTLTKVLNLWIPLNNSIQKNKTYYKKVFYSNTQLNEGNLWLCKELDNYSDRFQMYYGTIDVTYDITYLMIFIEANKIYTNETFKPMLVEGVTIPTTFLPYQDKYSAFLNVKGKNLLEFDDVENAITFNGMTYSIKNGVITVNGTPNAISRGVEIYFKPININIGDTYSIALFNQFTSPVGFFVKDKSNDGNANQYLGIDKNIATTWTVNAGSQYEAIVFYLEPNKTYTNLVIKPILVSGSIIPTEFEPYYSFTKEVLIKQPLRKFDYLTYDGVYRQTNEIVLDGSWDVVDKDFLWEDGRFVLSKTNVFFPLINNWEQPFSQLYITTTSDLPLLPLIELQYNKKKGIALNDGSMIIKLDDSADNSLNNWTVEKINNYFKQNPITITYKTVDQTFEATSLTRLLFKNGYNKITAFDSINNNAIVEYLEYYKSKGD